MFSLYTDYRGNRQRLAFLQYAFTNKEHPIQLKPHGNSKAKGKVPFRRTKPSTLRSIKSGAKSKSAVKLLHDIEKKAGGVISARAGCDLPQNLRQVYNAKRNVRSCSLPCQDTLAEVMRLCKETVSSDNVFIRSVEAAPEPMCVLATRQQLDDLERFCTGENFSVMSVDPTFNLGPFYVTPLTYKNKLARSRKKNGSNPLLLGPIFVHQTKTFHSFHYFASTLVRLNPNLHQIRAFGTDGECELFKAFQMGFFLVPHI